MTLHEHATFITDCLLSDWPPYSRSNSAAAQQLHLAPSPRFNHNDLHHVIQSLALIAFYQAGRRLPISEQEAESLEQALKT